MEFGESAFDAAKREVLEEVGIKLDWIDFEDWTETYSPDWGTHYINFIFYTEVPDSTEVTLSPDEVLEYMWAERDNLPTPLFRPFKQYFEYLGGESI